MYLVSISRVGIKIFWPVVKGTENGKNNNENFHNVHVILLIYVYAWLKYARLNRKDRLKDYYARYDIRSRHASRRQRVPQFTNVWLAPLTRIIFTTFECIWLWLVN